MVRFETKTFGYALLTKIAAERKSRAGIKSYHVHDIKFPHKSQFPQTATLDSREL